MASYKLNRMAGGIKKMEYYLPTAFHPVGYSFIFNNMVKLAGEILRSRSFSSSRRHFYTHVLFWQVLLGFKLIN
jgi:hypothetical protein